ncbi:phage holin family protein [Heyndrickxia sporothermodurans]|uniref:phage holin family protein n=1 Tax=Heyndrickxia sporothermodurans TaxID=46224 RepID=UPI002E1F8436|nr:phage holin family protein [Heyndrickxia sporothermodurans]MED3697927.1 phage holin family protein [Heyndrickxia sporothermodurans]
MDFLTEFGPYVGLAVILYALRATKKVSNHWIPTVAIVLGVLYSFWESHGVTPEAFTNGLQYALLGVGTVAGIKYYIENKDNGN